MNRSATPADHFPVVENSRKFKSPSWVKIITFSAILITASTSQVARAQEFSGAYTFTGTSGNVTNFSYNGAPIPHLAVGSLGKSNVISASSTGNFRAQNWPLDPSGTNVTGAVDANKYFDFSLTSESGYTFDMTSLNFGVSRSGIGPRTLQWRSSVDGFASTITNYTSLGPSGLFTQTNGILTITDSTSTAGTNVTLSLVESSYMALTSITFRCYFYNSETTNGTGGIQGPFTFSGSMIRPAGSTVKWTGDGTTGTWENGQPGKFGAAYANNLAVEVTFTGTGEVVAVNGGVQAEALKFDVPGYLLSGGSIELGLGVITATSGLATISSAIGGGSGLTKMGLGDVKLAGVNTFTGSVSVSAGTLEISGDAQLGAAGNDLVMNGTLRATNSISLGSGRDISGAATLDVATGSTLTVNGNSALTALTLANTGTIHLAGPTTSVGAITFNAAGALTGSTNISATGLTAPGVSTGTATVNAAMSFSTGNKTLDVPAGGTLVLNGPISNGGNSGRFTKTGAGKLMLNQDNTMGGLRIGVADFPPQDGGVVVLTTNIVGTQSQVIQHNYGTLIAATDLTGPNAITNGVVIGGRSGALAIFGAGKNIEFKGASLFYRGSSTSGYLRFDANTTVILHDIGPTTGSGIAAEGIMIGGTGTVSVVGDASLLGETITLQDAVDLIVDGTNGAAVNVGAGNVLGGNGLIVGSLHLASGAGLIFNPTNTLTVNGASVSFGGFGITDLIGFSPAVPDGDYKLIDGSASVSTSNMNNLGAEHAYDLGGGRFAYFEVGSLTLHVVACKVQFAESAAAVAEANTTYTVTVDKPIIYSDVSGQVALSGSATLGADYTISATNFTVNSATTSFTFTVTVTNDAVVEPAETIVMTLTNVTGAGIGTSSVFTLTINDDEVFTPPAPTQPTNKAVSAYGGALSLTLGASETGFRYHLLYTTNLAENPQIWNLLTTSNGTGGPLILTDPVATNVSRIYQIQAFYPVP